MRGYHMGTCARNATKDGYCKQHHPVTVAERNRISEERFKRQQANSPWELWRKAKEEIKELKVEIERLKQQLND